MLSQDQIDLIRKFPELPERETQFNRAFAYSLLPEIDKKKILDIGCGDGFDINFFTQKGAECTGLEIDHDKVIKARNKNPDTEIIEQSFDELPFENDYFDMVWSKYSLTQTPNLRIAIKEIAMILKPGGMFFILSVHPIRQLLHKNSSKKYFGNNKIIVDNIPGVNIVIEEYQYTFEDYLGYLLENDFEIKDFRESTDPSAENSETFIDKPDFFVIKAIKI